MRGRLLVPIIVTLCTVPALAQQPAAQPGKAEGAGNPSENDKPSEAPLLQVKIDASRSPIAMDTEAGVSAEIKNIGPVPVLLKERETVFVTMPEMRVYGGSGTGTPGKGAVAGAVQGCATFPTQHASDGASGDLLLQPNDSYRIFWDLAANGCTNERLGKVRFWDDQMRWLEQKWQRISFVPGKYAVYLDIVVHPNGGAAYRTATSAADIQVSASQQMVILGSFLGGILAYVIKWYYRVPTALIPISDDWLKTAIRYTEWAFAGLFGAVMAVLASRLSDTFPVKVSADDFWGAVTLGFIFQWIGVKLLEKLPGMGTPAPDTPDTPTLETPKPDVV
jgi:hypothetical protein